jgi:hypothetical protein
MLREVRAMQEAVTPGAAVVYALRAVEPRKEAMMRSELKPAFASLGKHVGSAASRMGGVLIESSANEEERIAAILAAAGLARWKQDALKPVFERAWRRGAVLTMQVLKRYGIEPTMRDKLAQSMLEQGGKRMGLVDITGDTKSALLKVIDDGRILGANPKVTAKLIEQYVPAGRFTNAGAGYRARMIARTETLHSARISSLEVYRASPQVKECMAFDGESDEECAARNGAVFTFDEAEAEANDTHPNCVLAFGPVV